MIKSTASVIVAICILSYILIDLEQSKVHEYLHVNKQLLGYSSSVESGRKLIVGDSLWGKSTVFHCYFLPYNSTMLNSPFVTTKAEYYSPDCSTFRDVLDNSLFMDTPGFDYALENTADINVLSDESIFNQQVAKAILASVCMLVMITVGLATILKLVRSRSRIARILEVSTFIS